MTMDKGAAASKPQDKAKEVAFFDQFATADHYDVFMPEAKTRIIDAVVRLGGLTPGTRIADLGCGSGAFTTMLQARGFQPVGLDISPKLIALARKKFSAIEFIEGDAENLPFADESLDAVLLSALVHHFPDPHRLAQETYRVLRRGGRFVAFDPNRMNPLMWLYRDPSSPLYSQVGVTENERPILSGQVAAIFRDAGFSVRLIFLRAPSRLFGVSGGAHGAADLQCDRPLDFHPAAAGAAGAVRADRR